MAPEQDLWSCLSYAVFSAARQPVKAVAARPTVLAIYIVLQNDQTHENKVVWKTGIHLLTKQR